MMQWAKREGASKWVLHDWTESVKSVINNRVNIYQFDRNKSVLSSHIAKEYLDSVHDNFVLALADKASNNVIIICKKFYHDVLARELGVDAVGRSSGNDTYKTCSIKEEKIIHDHISFLALEAKDKFLPSLYWLPKLHKDLYMFRYIAASSHCTAKLLNTLCWRIWQCLSCIRMVDDFNQRNCCPIAISDFDLDQNIWIFKSLFIITRNWYFNFYLEIFSHYVLVLPLADDGFAFV